MEAELINAIGPVVVLIAVFILTKIFDRMPQWLAPTLAVALGSLGTWLGSVATDAELDNTVAAFAGFAAVGIHQFLKKWSTAAGRFARGERQPMVGRSGRTP